MNSSQAYSRTSVHRVDEIDEEEFEDVLAVEEPLEIRIGFSENGKLTHRAVSITMRTPGDDEALAAGFLFTEGILKHKHQITRIRRCGAPVGGGELRNTIVVELGDGVDVDIKRLERNFYTTSSCGVCGKASIDALRTGVEKLPESRFAVSRDLILKLADQLRNSQDVFGRTGGLHASALFDHDGNIDLIKEDVGRHNALDKVIGEEFLAGEMPFGDRILMVSGRASFELVQKALMAGIPILAAVGAPSSLAVELAHEFGMTLIGFVRDGRFNVYCGKERLKIQNRLHKRAGSLIG